MKKEERSKPRKLNAKYTFMGSLAVFGNRFEDGGEGKRVFGFFVMKPNDPPKS